MNAPDSLWYYTDASNEPVGPLPFAELERLAAAGVIQAATHVIENGGREWKKFAAIVLPPLPAPILDPKSDLFAASSGSMKQAIQAFKTSPNLLVFLKSVCVIFVGVVLTFAAYKIGNRVTNGIKEEDAKRRQKEVDTLQACFRPGVYGSNTNHPNAKADTKPQLSRVATPASLHSSFPIQVTL